MNEVSLCKVPDGESLVRNRHAKVPIFAWDAKRIY